MVDKRQLRLRNNVVQHLDLRNPDDPVVSMGGPLLPVDRDECWTAACV
ncbi:hypothetical protein [Paracoccus aestuariivivens]|uniref:Uncharacterized protein n=1 Tax=Paracoccus aestuariivivens TaxID=1820333 RepID=A0A6L6JE35_9RHOB|nr:hypothetical protein [Paracoccus aestuariivivens]MTH80260.1 hypothetical protein [Paracoccus aestuariivivens]